jgi:hypothetical protein
MGWEFTWGFFALLTPEQLDERRAFWNYATGAPARKYRGDRPQRVLQGRGGGVLHV